MSFFLTSLQILRSLDLPKQTFNTIVFSYYLFMFFFFMVTVCSDRFRSGDLLGHCRPLHFSAFKKFWVAFSVCFRLLSVCTVTHYPLLNHLAEFTVSRQYTPTVYTSEFRFPQQPYILTFHYRKHFLPFSILSLSYHSSTNCSLSHLSIYCNSRALQAFLKMFLANGALVFLVLRFTNGLHLVVISLSFSGEVSS